MKNTLLHKRIYYVPGLITLAIAPIIFVARTNKYIADKTEHCISIIVGVKGDGEHDNFLFPPRDYQTFELTGIQQHDSSITTLIQYYAKGLHESKNDSIGLKVILTNKLKYKAYIGLLNASLKSQISDWIPFGDTVFIFHRNNPKDFNNNLCQNSLMPDIEKWGIDIVVDKDEPKLTLVQRIKTKKDMIRLASPFIVVYLLLVYLAIKKIKNEC
jgi:hypothetical protein